jgi:hypothetical protein
MVALVALSVAAGDWQPDPTHRFELQAPIEQPEQATSTEDRWVDHLVANLRKSGANPTVLFRFARSEARLTVNGTESDSPVFVLRDRPDMFLVTESDPSGRVSAHFLVDFKNSTIQRPGWGEALYVPPSRSFGVAVFDSANWLGGIPVNGGPGNPNFADRVASWF